MSLSKRKSTSFALTQISSIRKPTVAVVVSLSSIELPSSCAKHQRRFFHPTSQMFSETEASSLPHTLVVESVTTHTTTSSSADTPSSLATSSSSSMYDTRLRGGRYRSLNELLPLAHGRRYRGGDEEKETEVQQYLRSHPLQVVADVLQQQQPNAPDATTSKVTSSSTNHRASIISEVLKEFASKLNTVQEAVDATQDAVSTNALQQELMVLEAVLHRRLLTPILPQLFVGDPTTSSSTSQHQSTSLNTTPTEERYILEGAVDCAAIAGLWETAFLAVQKLVELEASHPDIFIQSSSALSKTTTPTTLLSPHIFTQAMKACVKGKQFHVAKTLLEQARRRYVEPYLAKQAQRATESSSSTLIAAAADNNIRRSGKEGQQHQEKAKGEQEWMSLDDDDDIVVDVGSNIVPVGSNMDRSELTMVEEGESRAHELALRRQEQTQGDEIAEYEAMVELVEGWHIQLAHSIASAEHMDEFRTLFQGALVVGVDTTTSVGEEDSNLVEFGNEAEDHNDEEQIARRRHALRYHYDSPAARKDLLVVVPTGRKKKMMTRGVMGSNSGSSSSALVQQSNPIKPLLKVSVPLYAAILRGCENAVGMEGKEKFALSLYRTLRDNQLVPNGDAYSSLVGIAATSKNTSSAFALFTEARVVLSGDPNHRPPPPPTSISSSTTKNGVGALGPIGSDSSILSLPPRLYTNLLRGYVAGGYGHDALKTFEVLKEAGVPLERAAYHVVLSLSPSLRESYTLVEQMTEGVSHQRGLLRTSRAADGSLLPLAPHHHNIDGSGDDEDSGMRIGDKYGGGGGSLQMQGGGVDAWLRGGDQQSSSSLAFEATPTTLALLIASHAKKGTTTSHSATLLSLFDLHQHALTFVKLRLAQRDDMARQIATAALDSDNDDMVSTHPLGITDGGLNNNNKSPKKDLLDYFSSQYSGYIRALEHALFSIRVDLSLQIRKSKISSAAAKKAQAPPPSPSQPTTSSVFTQRPTLPAHLVEKYGINHAMRAKASAETASSSIILGEVGGDNQATTHHTSTTTSIEKGTEEELSSLYPYGKPLIELVQHDMFSKYLKDAVHPQRPTTFDFLTKTTNSSKNPLLSSTTTTLPPSPLVAVLTADILADIELKFVPIAHFFSAIVVPFSQLVRLRREGGIVGGLVTSSSSSSTSGTTTSSSVNGNDDDVGELTTILESITPTLPNDIQTSESQNNTSDPDSGGRPTSLMGTAEMALSRQRSLIKFLTRYGAAVHIMSLQEELAMSSDVTCYNIPLSSLGGRAVSCAMNLSQGISDATSWQVVGEPSPSNSTTAAIDDTASPGNSSSDDTSGTTTNQDQHGGNNINTTNNNNNKKLLPTITAADKDQLGLYRRSKARFYVVSTEYKNTGSYILRNAPMCRKYRVRWLNPETEPDWTPPEEHLSVTSHVAQVAATVGNNNNKHTQPTSTTPKSPSSSQSSRLVTPPSLTNIRRKGEEESGSRTTSSTSTTSSTVYPSQMSKPATTTPHHHPISGGDIPIIPPSSISPDASEVRRALQEARNEGAKLWNSTTPTLTKHATTTLHQQHADTGDGGVDEEEAPDDIFY